RNPKELNSQIPDDLSLVILKCMEKDKVKRYQSAGEVRSELKNIEKGIPTTEKVIPKRKPLTSKEITVTFRLKRLLIPAIVAVALVLATVIIWQLLPKKEAIPPPSAKPSIAVLPFADLSPQKDQEYLCDGMTDEIIAKLSRIPGWKVMNRTSAMLYKKTDKDIKNIGQELNVTTILSGSMRKEKDDIRVSAQLINVEDSFLLWSDVYERKFDRVFEIQSDIAEEIAKALKTELSPEEKEGIKKKSTESIEAYDLYLRGRYFWNKRTTEGFQKSLEYFQKAIEKDQTFAPAYTGIADYFNLIGYYDFLPPKDAFPKAKDAAEKALELDETLAEAHTSLAFMKTYYEWDWEGAEKSYIRAIELNPSYATAHIFYAELLATIGRHNESIAEVKRAQELDPASTAIRRALGGAFLFARRYDKAIEEYQNAIEMDPSSFVPHFYLTFPYAMKGLHDEAIAEARKAMKLSGRSPAMMCVLSYAYAISGKQAEAKKLLIEINALSKKIYISPAIIGLIYVGFGEKDEAFEWLEAAYQQRDHWLYQLKVAPWLDSLRQDSRFKEMLRKMNLE
ncbi:MAG: tetratricopeptide repeat protein, partial [Candidatus Aminicenantes bacterium]|nr:tetratricopeptide repeat protein [Candidatus Aminicenantes bacterium]